MPYSTENGLKIWYEVKGDGPAMVFLHANPFDHDLWLYQTAHFSTWFRTIAIDIRGYGRSETREGFTLADLRDDVLGVMRDAGVDRAICLGCSVGSGLALLLGLDRPDLFDALVLVGGNSGNSARFGRRIDNYRADLGAYHIKHMRDLVSLHFAESRIGQHLLNMFVEREPRLSGEAIARVFMAGNSTDTTERLPTMTVPTLVINGEHDHSLPAGQRTASLIPGAQHRILAGTGHACCIEDPAGFDALVLAFLREKKLLLEL